MAEDQAAFRLEPLQLVERLADVLAVKDDLGSVAQARRDLRRDSRKRHHNDHAHAELASRPGVALRRVAGGHRDDSCLALSRRKRGHLVEGASRLERAGLLEVLSLEVQPGIRNGHP